jgi:hypothetical protein
MTEALTVKIDSAEVMTIAREMARAYLSMAEFYRDKMKQTQAEADASARPVADDEWRRRMVEGPADQVGWWGLSSLAESDPKAAYLAWERIKAEARDELASGHRAAKAFDFDSRPWERAQFLALREAFRLEWKPSGGIEAALVDTLSQAHSAYLFWLGQLYMQSTTEAKLQDFHRKKDGEWDPPRVRTSEAVDQSAAMMDRFNRLFLRTLRALRDLRRYSPSVLIQNAQQVNVAADGSQQLNLAASVTPPP